MKKTVLSILLASAFLTACVTTQTTQKGTVGVERTQTMSVSAEEVNREAAEAYRATIESARRQGALNRNAAQYKRVKTISDNLVGKVANFRTDAPSWKWEVNVLSSDQVNAWCMPGGKMAVYTGIIDQLKLTDDELAAIMGHEIAHALREHGREKVSQAQNMGVLTAIGGAVIGATVGAKYGISAETSSDILGTVADLGFMRPNSREMEQESDRIGIELAARAGYNPNAAITLWEKMAKLGGSGGPAWLSTHPSNEARIADLRNYAKLVEPLYEEAKKATPVSNKKAPAKKPAAKS